MASRVVYNCDICGAEYQLSDGEHKRKICKYKGKGIYLASLEVSDYTGTRTYIDRLDICSNCCKTLKETINTLKENNLGCDITVDMEED